MQATAAAISIDETLCTGCAGCSSVCPSMAVMIRGNRCEIREQLCTGCGKCADACPVSAIIQSERNAVAGEV
jgi:ferredoxin